MKLKTYCRKKPWLLTGLCLLLGCWQLEVIEYSPEQDDQAMAAIASTWKSSDEENPVVLTLCEDIAKSETFTFTPGDYCLNHVIKGGGRGRRHIEGADWNEGFLGMEGCRGSGITAFVRGTLSGGGLEHPIAVTGSVDPTLQGLDSYGFPFGVDLEYEGELPMYFSGSIEKDGSLTLRDDSFQKIIFEPGIDSGSELKMVRVDAAVCAE